MKKKIRFYEKVSECRIKNKFGKWKLILYRNRVNFQTHIALLSEKFNKKDSVILRIHSSCVTGDIFYDQRCECRKELDFGLEKAAKENGLILYLFQEGRNIGLGNKVEAYSLQEKGLDTKEANIALNLPVDNREYQCAVEILENLGIKKVRLITRNKDKIRALKKRGIEVVEIISPQIQ